MGITGVTDPGVGTHSRVHDFAKHDLPSHDGGTSREPVGGVGTLPGGKDEEGVGLLPDEREEENNVGDVVEEQRKGKEYDERRKPVGIIGGKPRDEFGKRGGEKGKEDEAMAAGVGAGVAAGVAAVTGGRALGGEESKKVPGGNGDHVHGEKTGGKIAKAGKPPQVGFIVHPFRPSAFLFAVGSRLIPRFGGRSGHSTPRTAGHGTRTRIGRPEALCGVQ